MKRIFDGKSTLLLIIVITFFGFFAWVGMIFILWLLLGLLRISTDLWAMIEALSTALAAAAVFTAGFIAYRELSEISSSRHLEVIDRLFEELNSTDNIDARRWIFQNLPDNPEEGLNDLTPEGRTAIKRVLNSLDRVALLTQPGWIDEKLVMPWMNPMIVKSWSKLERYVTYESTRRKEPDYYQNARRLAERCIAWRESHIPDSKNVWVVNAL